MSRQCSATVRFQVASTLVSLLIASSALAVQPGPINFPTLGIGPGQTLRLNAVAVQPGPSQSPAAGCVAILSFSDPAGNVMVQPGPTQINLSPGQAAFLDLPSGGLRLGQRLEARPTVAF